MSGWCALWTGRHVVRLPAQATSQEVPTQTQAQAQAAMTGRRLCEAKGCPAWAYALLRLERGHDRPLDVYVCRVHFEAIKASAVTYGIPVVGVDGEER